MGLLVFPEPGWPPRRVAFWCESTICSVVWDCTASWPAVLLITSAAELSSAVITAEGWKDEEKSPEREKLVLSNYLP